MRRPLLVGLALLLVPALAFAGKTVTEGNATLKIKAKFDPATASKSKKKRRPIAVDYDYFAGTTNDQRLPELRSVKVFLGGAKFGFGAFPTCDETDAANEGEGVCPEASLVGEGTGVAEVHPPNNPTDKSDLALDVHVYNGELDTDRNGDPADPRAGLLIYTEVGDTPVILPFWGERRGRQVSYYNPVEDQDPNADALYEIKEIHLKLDRRAVRRDGRRIPFIGAPTDCDGRWIVTTTNEPYRGQAATARHKVRCEDA